MTWHPERHFGKRCECGLVISPGNRWRHERSVWHQRFREVDEMLARGLSQAEVGRQLGVTRMYVGRYLMKRREASRRKL